MNKTFTRKIYLVLLLAKLVPAVLRAQDQPLLLQLKKIDTFLSLRYTQQTPGCVFGIVKDHKLVYNRGFGMANIDAGIPMTPASTMNIMSVSKQFTAAAIALLIIDQKVSLEDDVHTYIPELPEYGYKISIGHLIRHTSGIRDYNDLVTLSGGSAENKATRSDGLAIVLKQKELNFTPGSRYAYSNSGYLLLSYIVERVSGMSFEKFTRERIFKPLNMNHSFFSDDSRKRIKNGVISYGKDESGKYFPFTLKDERMGCAGLYTTVGDLFKWDQNFYTSKLGGAKLNELMLSLDTLNDGKENDYAFGNIIDKHEGFREVLHSGGLLGIRCKLSRFPSENLSVIYLGNGSQDLNAELYPIASLLLLNKPLPTTAAATPGPTNTDKQVLSEKEMETYAGLYSFPEINLLGLLNLNDKGYMEWGTTNRSEKSRLFVESKNEFKINNGQIIRFTPGSTDSVLLITKSGRFIYGSRVESATEEKLDKYTGKYYSDEASAYIEVKRYKNNLVFQVAGTKVSQPLPLNIEHIQFNNPLLGTVTISFKIQKDEENHSLFLTTDRTSNLAFKKIFSDQL